MNKKKKSLTYSSSGVDIKKANQLVEEIKSIVKKTNRLGADVELGGFGGIFDIRAIGYNDPLLVSSTDGVGTKLLLAIENNCYENIGIDLVAMCVNDLIVQGAEPLFFLDYFSTGSLSKKITRRVIKSISEGCEEANCALIGGETAEMPDFYSPNHFDLAGFSVGAVEREKLLPRNVVSGDVIIGIPSSGLHSNGYSLVRNVIKNMKLDVHDKTPYDNSKTFLEEFLSPTKIYVKQILQLLKNTEGVKGIAHITGGGLTENIPRIFKGKNITAEIDVLTWEKPKIYKWLYNSGNIKESEMLKTFNYGIGMALIVDQKKDKEIMNFLSKYGEESYKIGKIVENKGDGSKVDYV